MKKVVFVTGASGNLGSVIVQKLRLKKYKVYSGSRTKAGREGWIQLDITSDSDCRKAIKQIIDKEGRIDVLVNNAGLSLAGPTAGFSSKDYLNILNINAVGAFRLIKEVIPYMKKQKSGKIINITSLNGFAALPNFGLYSSSKFALEALGQSLRYELAGSGIWVTNIAPGAILNKSENSPNLPHKSAREKFWFLKILLPMISNKEVAREVINVIKNPSPPPRVILGNDAKITYLLQKFLPMAFWDKLMLYIWNKD